ncbi:unnamed protein product [Arctogadus glacialis]
MLLGWRGGLWTEVDGAEVRASPRRGLADGASLWRETPSRRLITQDARTEDPVRPVLCLEVQKRCPFILPDNDDLIHGGSTQFYMHRITSPCSLPHHANDKHDRAADYGLLEDFPAGVSRDVECCDVRWGAAAAEDPPRQSHAPCRAAALSSAAAATRQGGLCLLALVLLHTVASLTAAHNATGLGLPATSPLEESPANEE